MTKYLALIVFVLFLSATTAQEKTGLTLGKHNGITATHINPALSLRSENKWQLTLGGGHLFADTNYGYITNTNPLDLARNQNEVYIPESDGDRGTIPGERTAVFKASGKSYVDARAEVIGPGFLWKLNETTSVGLSTRMRAMASSFDIPEVVNYNTANNLAPDSIYVLEQGRGSGMVWAEIGLHYAQQLDEQYQIGGTVKYLRSYASAYGKNEFAFDFEEFDNENLDIITDGSFSLGYPASEEGLAASGNGLGIDMGISAMDVLGAGSLVGFSILDLGIVKTNAPSRTYGFDSSFELDGSRYNSTTELDVLRTQLDMDFIVVDSSATYTMLLPTALSAQVVYPISKQLTVEGAWTQRVVPTKSGRAIARGNSISVAGVYERKHFSAFLPVTLYGYSDLRFGAAVRLGPLTIGSDHIMSLIGKRNFNGTDLYALLQVYPFGLGMTKGQNRQGKGKGNVSCYW